MIIAERKAQTTAHDYDRFGEAMTDGRLTAAAEGRIYRVRDIVLETRRLGRQLTQEELERFVIE